MSQPPSPFERSYSFTDFSINTPNLQQPGNKIDQELNNVRTSLNATISRLGEVQNDDGSVKVGSVDVASIITQVSGPVALDRMLAESAKNDAVLKAAEVDAAKTYVTNVADGLVPAVQMILQNAQDVLAPAAESAFNAEQFSISANQSALAASESYSLSNIARNDAAIAASQAISAAASAAISAASAPAIPTGGSAGQVLSKVDSTDYNTQWIDAPNGGTADALPLAGGTMNVGAVVDFASTSGKDSEIGAWGFGVEDSSGNVSTIEPHQIHVYGPKSAEEWYSPQTYPISNVTINKESIFGTWENANGPEYPSNFALSRYGVAGNEDGGDANWGLGKTGVSGHGADNDSPWVLSENGVSGNAHVDLTPWSLGNGGLQFTDGTIQTTAAIDWKAGGTMNTGSNIGFGIPGNEEWSILDLNGLFVTNTDGEKASNINGSNISQFDGSYEDSLAILNGRSGLEFFNWYDKSEVYAKYRPTGITFADGTVQTTAASDFKAGGTLNDYAGIKLRKPYFEDEEGNDHPDGVVLIYPNFIEVGWDTGYPNDEYQPLYRTTIVGDTITQREDANFNVSTYSSYGWSVASGALIGDASGITFPDSTIQTTAAILPPNDPDDLAQAYNNNGVWTNSPCFDNLNIFGSMYVDNDLVLNAGTPAVIKFDDGGFEFRKTNIKFPDGSTQASAFIPSNYLTASSIASTYLSQSSAASTYYTKPTGTTGQYIRGDGSFATYSSGDKYLTSSTTSLTISNGSKTLTIGTGLSYSTQQDVTIAYDSSNHMHATVTSYNSSTGVIVCDVYNKAGSGTYAAWTVNVGGVQGGSYLQISNNLSDLTSASTARTNLGLAYATDAQVVEGTSASTVLTPSSSQQLLDVNTYGGYQLSGFSWTSVTAGTGGATYQVFPPNKEVQVTTAIGSSLLYANLYSGSRGRLVSNGADWSKKNSFSIRIARNNTPATNTIFRCYLSHKSMATKALDARGIGFIIDGAGNIVIHAHNGTGLSTGTTTFASVNTFTDIKIESDGSGTTTCFVNGTSVGTCSGSPTTNASNTLYFNIELENTSVQSASQTYYTAYAKIDLA